MHREVTLALAFALAPCLAFAQTVTNIGATGGGGTALFGDSTEVFTFGWTPAAGDLTIFCLGGGGVTTANIASASGMGGTWADVAGLTNTAGGVECTWTRDGSGSGNQLTINTTAADGSANIRWAYWTFRQSGGAGFDAASEHVSTQNNSTSGTNAHSSGSTTPSDANNFCVGLGKGTSGDYSGSIAASWTNTALNDTARGRAGYIIQSSATSQAWTHSSAAAEDTGLVIVCVDSPSGGGGGGTILTHPNTLTLGVGAR